MRLTPLESLLNRNIAASAAARNACGRLGNKVLALHFDATPLQLYVSSDGREIALHTQSTTAPDATLSGTPLALLRLAGAQPEIAFRSSGVRIEGNAEVAQAFSELLKHAQPDFEEELSRMIGDVAAHQVGNIARSMFAFGRRAADTLAMNVSEYLQEEGRDVPSRTEADEFIAGVDQLRDDTDRLEARIRLLTSRKG